MAVLSAMPDVISAASGFSPEILAGTVTVAQVLDRIAAGENDLVHFATHGREHALSVTDGIVEEDMLEQAIRAGASVRVLVLNACKSMHAAAEVFNNTGVAFSIGWPSDVADRLAGEWARLFYRALVLVPERPRQAAGVANDALVKSQRVNPDDLPVVLTGRVVQATEECEQLRRELRRRGVARIPTWAVVANAVLVAVLLVSVLVLAAGR